MRWVNEWVNNDDEEYEVIDDWWLMIDAWWLMIDRHLEEERREKNAVLHWILSVGDRIFLITITIIISRQNE